LKTGFQYAETSASNADRRTSPLVLRIADTTEWRVTGKEAMPDAVDCIRGW
jgi:hypothetical protein